MNTEELLNAARLLTRADRLELVQAIWDTLAEDTVPLLDEELRAELDRRIAASEVDPNNVLTWDEVKRRVRSSRSNA